MEKTRRRTAERIGWSSGAGGGGQRTEGNGQMSAAGTVQYVSRFTAAQQLAFRFFG